MKLYRAVIENNISPKKDGRVQVRVIGIHDEKLKNVKTEHLPWAEVIQSTAFGFSSGVGFSSIPNIGTWVFVTMDHENPNMFIVLGAISGKSTKKADTTVGFNSPDGIFPLEDRLNEEDQNRLQRVNKLEETIHKSINDDNETPYTPFPESTSQNSVYPNNAVIETKSGHVIEIDDTEGNERIRMYHTSGTYTDYRPDGSISGVVQKDIDKIVKGCVREYIKGLFQITADNGIEITSNVKIIGELEVTKRITASDNISSKKEIADSKGNLSSLRDAFDTQTDLFDSHTHKYKPGSGKQIQSVTAKTSGFDAKKDPKKRWGDYNWTETCPNINN